MSLPFVKSVKSLNDSYQSKPAHSPKGHTWVTGTGVGVAQPLRVVQMDGSQLNKVVNQFSYTHGKDIPDAVRFGSFCVVSDEADPVQESFASTQFQKPKQSQQVMPAKKSKRPVASPKQQNVETKTASNKKITAAEWAEFERFKAAKASKAVKRPAKPVVEYEEEEPQQTAPAFDMQALAAVISQTIDAKMSSLNLGIEEEVDPYEGFPNVHGDDTAEPTYVDVSKPTPRRQTRQATPVAHIPDPTYTQPEIQTQQDEEPLHPLFDSSNDWVREAGLPFLSRVPREPRVAVTVAYPYPRWTENYHAIAETDGMTMLIYDTRYTSGGHRPLEADPNAVKALEVTYGGKTLQVEAHAIRSFQLGPMELTLLIADNGYNEEQPTLDNPVNSAAKESEMNWGYPSSTLAPQ